MFLEKSTLIEKEVINKTKNKNEIPPPKSIWTTIVRIKNFNITIK